MNNTLGALPIRNTVVDGEIFVSLLDVIERLTSVAVGMSADAKRSTDSAEIYFIAGGAETVRHIGLAFLDGHDTVVFGAPLTDRR